MGFYFDRVYNPVYDFIVGQNAPYRDLQQTCVDRLELADGDMLVCAGVGTGNEILHILRKNPRVRITAIDSSNTALKKAQKKARKMGVHIETRLMDIQKLDFADATFDKALCIHVMDFVQDTGKATRELLRVLKKNGKFAITFPSAKEDLHFGAVVIGETIRRQARNRKYYKIPLILVSSCVAAIVYLPFIFRKERRQYAGDEIGSMFTVATKSTNGQFRIEEFPAYCDYVIHGSK